MVALHDQGARRRTRYIRSEHLRPDATREEEQAGSNSQFRGEDHRIVVVVSLHTRDGALLVIATSHHVGRNSQVNKSQ